MEFVNKQVLVAAFSSYQNAHNAMQKLHGAGINDFTVLYLQKNGDQNGDGVEGFYPSITPNIQSVIDGPVQGEIEAPQLFVLPGHNNQRTQVGIEDRLESYGVPESTVDQCTAQIEGGNVLAVIRDSERMDNISQLLKAETDFVQLV
ncbi:hypothetical protein CIG75_05095 [Tumebacillus algifaecis]|uniref:Uncharacterized protein n=1 Tax=Tumebacillus algifaecis TaxID=1214604 RepID=A0A223CZ10_9BACL|nr:hypothetical protein [Tumebacillus algifaecis]ASS74424.1 hypothetical protein CIG75_05095 [Tumebacillus algifaecis]